MVINISKKQLKDLVEILNEYREESWHAVFEYKKYEMSVDDPMIKEQYARIAEEEEEKHSIALKLHEYLSAIPIPEDD